MFAPLLGNITYPLADRGHPTVAAHCPVHAGEPAPSLPSLVWVRGEWVATNLELDHSTTHSDRTGSVSRVCLTETDR